MEEIKSPIIDYRAFLKDILMNSVCRTIIISLSRGNLESECKAYNEEDNIMLKTIILVIVLLLWSLPAY